MAFPQLLPSSSRHQLQQDGLLPLRGGRQLLAGLLHADLNEATKRDAQLAKADGFLFNDGYDMVNYYRYLYIYM